VSKQFYLMAGLERSGATLLSTLLNQHRLVYVGPISPVLDYVDSIHTTSLHNQPLQASRDYHGFYNIMQNLFPNYYDKIKKPIIIDRTKNWGTQSSYEIYTKFINPNPKIIFTVRPILEILASFIYLVENSEDNNDFIDKAMIQDSFLPYTYLPLNDARCEYLMRPHGNISNALLSIYFGVQRGYHFVQYGDLLTNTQKVMDDIFDFIGINSIPIQTQNLVQKETYYDRELGLPANLHKVKNNVEGPSYEVQHVLSPYIMQKYASVDTWLGRILSKEEKYVNT
jgi:hypothetical protein